MVSPAPCSPVALAVLDPDVVVFQLWQTDAQIARIKEYRKVLKKAFFVYEIDDLFWDVPAESVHASNPLVEKSRTQIRTAAKLCDAITVSTEPLVKEMRSLTGLRYIRHVANEVPKNFINAALAGHQRRVATAGPNGEDRFRIGWAGGIGHGGDLALIRDAVAAFPDVQWVFLGLLPPGVSEGPNVEYHPGVPFGEYPGKLGSLNLDLALAPLLDNPFNRCKSNLRLLEYGAAGFPVLASPASAYTGAPVFFTEDNSAESWIASLRRIMDDNDAREEQAEQLHAWVCNDHCMDDHLGRMVSNLLPHNTVPFIPGAARNHVGEVVTVGAKVEGLLQYDDIKSAWLNAPGADVLYVRTGTTVSETQAARIINAMDAQHASVSAITNDGIFPNPGKYTPLPHKIGVDLDAAAIVSLGQPISAPFPAGPCMLLSGVALANVGLPDVDRFGSVEFAMADWGTRCAENGRCHILITNTFIHAERSLDLPPEASQYTLEHIKMWTPGMQEFIDKFKDGVELNQARENLELSYDSMFHTSPPIRDYGDWVRAFDTITPEIREWQSKDIATWASKPLISVVMPVFNADHEHLRSAIRSVKNQTYENWQLLISDDCSTDEQVRVIIEEERNYDARIHVEYRQENGHICKATNSALDMASGLGWVVFLDHDDELTQHALYMVARELNLHPDTKFIYSDSDKLDANENRVAPYFTPDFSYELLLGQNYVTHLCAYKCDVVKRIGGLREGLEGSQDWDLTLRYMEEECGTPPDPKFIRHIPSVLYHWRLTNNSTSTSIAAKPYALAAGRRAVTEHLARTGQAAFVGPNPAVPVYNMVRFLVPSEAPHVTIIVPTHDGAKQVNDGYPHLVRCIASVLGATTYANFDVLILDNASKDKATRNFLAGMAKDKRVRVEQMPAAFNYSSFCNHAAKIAKGEYLCFLNDDTEILEPSWLNDMVALAMRPKVGAVGAKLVYIDNTIQHAGIIFSTKQDPGQSSLHLWQKLPMFSAAQAGQSCLTRPVAAVTGACMVIRASTYRDIGGMDADQFPLDYSDVDLCLRLHTAGYRNIVCAQALLRHYEGATKKAIKASTHEIMVNAEKRLLAKHADFVDPYANPNLAFMPFLPMSNTAPKRPWEPAERGRVLIINGDNGIAAKEYQNGNIPFQASLEGHYLTFVDPEMRNVAPVDVRESDERFTYIMAGRLGVTRIVVCGIGDGTLGALGFLVKAAESGFSVQYSGEGIPDAAQNYDPESWRRMWNVFLSAAERSMEDIAA